MSESNQVIGKRFSCPGCDALLKFKRPPTRLVQTCPNCRRLLRLQDKISTTDGNELQAAIDEFVSREKPPPLKLAYELDPRLDQITTTETGELQFDQPWPEGIGHVLYERTDVAVNPYNIEGNMLQRRLLMGGFHRRVTMYRTGEVEEMVVVGHWWDRHDVVPHEGIVGALPRRIVRELNRMPISTVYGARINCAVWVRDRIDQVDHIELYIDVAKSDSEQHEPRSRKPIR